MRKTGFGLLALLVPALSWGQQVAAVRSVPVTVPVVQTAALAVSAVLAAPTLAPSMLPSLPAANNPVFYSYQGASPTPVLSAQPIVLPKAVAAAASAAPAATLKPVARVESVQSQAQALVAEVADLAKIQAEPAVQNQAISRTFDAARKASVDGIDEVDASFRQSYGEALPQADSARTAELRSFRKELKAYSRAAALDKASADYLIAKARKLGVPIRIHASDLQATNNHWKRGPHIHVGEFHIPVEAGYVPELMPGGIHLN
ncbi:MAG: hypothetical protein WC969_04580 [Elusimicrobiota bacterium]|jgi:hypothetical protein